MGKMLALCMLTPFLVIFSALTVMEMKLVYDLIFDGVSTTGKVISYDTRTVQTGNHFNQRSYSSYFHVVLFVVEEKVFRVTAEIGSSNTSFNEGTEVPLRYLKSNPNRVVIQNFFYSFLRPFSLAAFSLIIFLVTFKIYSGPTIDLPVAGVDRWLILPGAGIAIFFGLVMLAIGLNMGTSRLKNFINGSIHSGLVLESTLEVRHEETKIVGKKIKSQSK